MGHVGILAHQFEAVGARPAAEAEIRRRLHSAVGQALVDPAFAAWLMAEPDAALGRPGLPPRQQLALQRVRASSLPDFARQVEQIFWPSRLAPSFEQEQMPRAVAR